MTGWNLEDYVQKTSKTYRQGNLYPSKPSFTLMDGDYYSTESGGKSWGLVGFFTRIDYALKDRYMAEFSARYDGRSGLPFRSMFRQGCAGWRTGRRRGPAAWLSSAGCLPWADDRCFS